MPRPRGEPTSARAAERERSFEMLVNEYQSLVYSFALRLSGRREDAEEIAQDTFVRAYRALSDYDDDRIRALRARPWLLQIALNVFRNRVRGRRLATQPLDDDRDDAPALQVESDARERPEEVVESSERQRELAAHLAALPVHFRVAVVLRHVEGLGYGEIAAILGQPVGTVKAHVHRGSRQLRAALEPERSEVGIR